MTITLEAAKTALHEAVAEKGENYKYKPYNGYGGECTYAAPTEEGTFEPSCIVGQVIFKLEPETFKQIAEHEWEFDGDEHYPTNALNVLAIAERFTGLFESRALAALEVAQSTQDAGRTWGIVQHVFDERAKRGW